LARISEALYVLREYAQRLVKHEVNVSDLLVSKRLSKRPSEYKHDVFQAVTARQLLDAGFDVYPGQNVQYLIVDADSKRVYNRVRAAQLLGSKLKFDVEKYLELLISSADTLFNVFGYDYKRIHSYVLNQEKQAVLS